jgi:hypothetical protein
VVHRLTTAGQRRRHNRWLLAKRVWWHPERAIRAERRSFFEELARGLLLAIASTAVTVPARRAVTTMLRGGEAEPAPKGNRQAVH